MSGDGRDVIQNVTTAKLSAWKILRLSKFPSRIYGGRRFIKFTDGGSVQINSAADVTYQSPTAKYSANHKNPEWLERK